VVAYRGYALLDAATGQVAADADDVVMKATAVQANPARPACPSIIMGIFKASK